MYESVTEGSPVYESVTEGSPVNGDRIQLGWETNDVERLPCSFSRKQNGRI